MLTHPTYDRLVALGLTGMAKALEEQRGQRNVEGLTFEERLGLLVAAWAIQMMQTSAGVDLEQPPAEEADPVRCRLVVGSAEHGYSQSPSSVLAAAEDAI